VQRRSGPWSLLIKNVQIFDGICDQLIAGHVLIDGRTIAAVETSELSPAAS
jgi:adenine deaminase